jgi:hypothetical protein
MTITVLIPLAVIAIATAIVIYFLVMGICHVPEGKVGLVYRRRGGTRPGDERFGQVRVHGSQGRQAQTLRTGRHRVPRHVCRVTLVPRTRVPEGTIGVVLALHGVPRSASRHLCRHVDCDYFQDGVAFLLGGGEQGRQPGILPGGASYDINPWLFDVITVKNIGSGRAGLTVEDLLEVSVPEGSTGVVTTLEGPLPADEYQVGQVVAGHDSFQRPEVFLDRGGQKGTQEQTLRRGGVYRINPWFARITFIPTQTLILEWSPRSEKKAGNFDAALDQVNVNVDGYRLRFTMTQTIRIPESAAPMLVGRFGDQAGDTYGAGDRDNPAPVQRFVARVLAPTVAGYFTGIASGAAILEFLAQHEQVILELEDRVRHALQDWGVEAVRTTLGEAMSDSTELDELRKRKQVQRDELEDLGHARERAAVQREIDAIGLETERDRRKLNTVEHEETVRVNTDELRQKIAMLGRDTISNHMYLEALTKMGVPQWVGGDANALLNYMPMSTAQNLLNSVLGQRPPDPRLPKHEAAELHADDGVPPGEASAPA